MSGGPSRRLFALAARRRPRPERIEPESLMARRRAAQLASLGTELGLLSHDLRGVLSPALLAAERLQMHSDPAARRSAEVLVRAVERAMTLLRDRLGPLRDELPTAARVPVPLREAIEAAAPAGLFVTHDVPADTLVEADPGYLREAWQCLFAHLRSGGATRATISAGREGRACLVTITHDGKAIPGDKPDATLDLAIARDLLRACGGALTTEAGVPMTLLLPL